MAKKSTVFQALDKAITGNWKQNDTVTPHVNSYDFSSGSEKDVIFRTTDKDEYLQKKLELQQNSYLKDRWVKANVNLAVTAYAGLNNVKLMYRDADLMDAFPEIGAALDIVSEESTIVNDRGMVVNVYSKSDRIKNILEDLFMNRLNIQLTGQMIIRAMCKYGNQFMLLDIDHKNGIKGWKQLPVFNIERIESGIQNPYGAGMSIAVNGINKDDADLSTQFIWLDDNNSQIPFRDWQIAHFRLLTNSLYLPYGVSYLNAARRHWRMLSLMEDMMLIYRLDRSIERRVYKIFVGAIDDADVPAYVEQIANEFKRTPIIDPVTGQVDLRKNILSIDQDIFIPVRDEGAPTPIDTLAAGQNIPCNGDSFMPNDKGIKLQDILEFGYADKEKSLCMTRRYAGFAGTESYLCRRYFGKSFGQAVFSSKEDRDITYNLFKEDSYFDKDTPVESNLKKRRIRQLTVTEAERLQTLPDGYTQCEGVSDSKRIEAIGNGWTVDVIVHLLKGFEREKNT